MIFRPEISLQPRSVPKASSVGEAVYHSVKMGRTLQSGLFDYCRQHLQEMGMKPLTSESNFNNLINDMKSNLYKYAEVLAVICVASGEDWIAEAFAALVGRKLEPRESREDADINSPGVHSPKRGVVA